MIVKKLTDNSLLVVGILLTVIFLSDYKKRKTKKENDQCTQSIDKVLKNKRQGDYVLCNKNLINFKYQVKGNSKKELYEQLSQYIQLTAHLFPNKKIPENYQRINIIQKNSLINIKAYINRKDLIKIKGIKEENELKSFLHQYIKVEELSKT